MLTSHDKLYLYKYRSVTHKENIMNFMTYFKQRFMCVLVYELFFAHIMAFLNVKLVYNALLSYITHNFYIK